MIHNGAKLISFEELLALARTGTTMPVRVRGEVQGAPTNPGSGWARMDLVDTVGEMNAGLRSLHVLFDASAVEQLHDGDIADVEGSLGLENTFSWRLRARRVSKCAGRGRLAPRMQRAAARQHPDLCREALERLTAGRRALKTLPAGLPAAGALRVTWIGPISHHARKDVQGHLPERVKSEWRQVSFYNSSAIAEAITDNTPDCDVIVVYRGGGGWRDWLPLNDVRVLNAVAQSRIPVVTAIGHETTDVTISWLSEGDFGTPTEVRKAFATLAYPRATAPDRPVADEHGKLIERLRSDLAEATVRLRRSEVATVAHRDSERQFLYHQIHLAQSFALYRIRVRGVRQGILSLLLTAATAIILPVALADRPWWVVTGAFAGALVTGGLLTAFSLTGRRRALMVSAPAARPSPETGSAAWFDDMSAVRSPRQYRRRRAY